MSEIELVREICAEADHRGLMWHHCGDSRACKGNRGFPDLVIAGTGGLLLAEVKSPTGQTTPEQDLWAWHLTNAMRAGRLDYRLWNARHWEEGMIDGALGRLA